MVRIVAERTWRCTAVPLPKQLARFNRVTTNRVAFPVARRVPGFAVVLHTGRRSGCSYRTPVNAFRAFQDTDEHETPRQRFHIDVRCRTTLPSNASLRR